MGLKGKNHFTLLFFNYVIQTCQAVETVHPSKSVPRASAWQQRRLYQLRTSGCCGSSLEYDLGAEKPLKSEVTRS